MEDYIKSNGVSPVAVIYFVYFYSVRQFDTESKI